MNIWNRIVDIFSKTVVPIEEPIENRLNDASQNAASENEFFRSDAFIDLDNKLKEHIVLNDEFIKPFMDLRTHFLNLGYRDGRAGFRSSSISDYATALAQKFSSFISSAIGGKLSSAEKKLIEEQGKVNKLKTEYDNALKGFEFYENKRLHNPKQFSWVYVVLFALASLMMMVSDIILTQPLLVYAFDLDNTPLTGWLATIGIISISLYFKIMYDEFISGASEDQVRFEKSLKKEYSEDEIKEVQKARRKKKFIMFLLGSMIVAFCYFFAGTRSESRIQMTKQEQDGEINFSEITQDSVVPPPISKEIKAAESSDFSTTFIFLSLLLPIVSGVFLSVSMESFINLQRLKKYKRGSDLNYEKWIQQTAGIDIYQEVNRLQSLRDWCGDSEDENNAFIRHYSKLFISMYNRGVENAIGAADPATDLFVLANNARRTSLMLKTIAYNDQKQSL